LSSYQPDDHRHGEDSKATSGRLVHRLDPSEATQWIG
jgi:hypothetical protein